MAISPKMSDVYGSGGGVRDGDAVGGAFQEHLELSPWQKGQVTDSHALEFTLPESIQMLSLSLSLRQVTKDTPGDPHEAVYISWKSVWEAAKEREIGRESTHANVYNG